MRRDINRECTIAVRFNRSGFSTPGKNAQQPEINCRKSDQSKQYDFNNRDHVSKSLSSRLAPISSSADSIFSCAFPFMTDVPRRLPFLSKFRFKKSRNDQKK